MEDRTTSSAGPAPPYPDGNINTTDYASTIPPQVPMDSAGSLSSPADKDSSNARKQPFQHATAPAAAEKSGRMQGAADRGLDYKLVTFAPGDPEDPKNWSKAFKWYITMVVAATCFVVALCSSIITSDVLGVEESFNVSHEAALVPISVFVVGFGVGKSTPCVLRILRQVKADL